MEEYNEMLKIVTKVERKMAKNTGLGYRKGSVTGREQVLNPKTGLYVKRDMETGRFMSVKTTGGKYKGVAENVDERRKYANK